MSSARVLIASVLLVWQISVASGATWQVQPAVVTIADGQLQGAVSGAVERFLGIPYAAPPVGELRFAPPQDVAPWDGVLNATSLPNRCPVTAGLGAARSETEDCLYLNLVRPAGISADSRLPVFVFIHGGGLTSGSANQYDLGAMVEANGFIGVSINYRLGLLGFLADPAVGQGNYGLMDQQAALRWVQANIGAFGGDPDRVTIGGESSGGASVCAHVGSPASSGLFAAAIIQSGGCWAAPIDMLASQATTISADLGCRGPHTSACLRSLPVSAFLDADVQGAVNIVYGTDLLPISPDDALATESAGVPVLLGWNRDEARSVAALGVPINVATYQVIIRQLAGDATDDVLARYPWPGDGDSDLTGYYAVSNVVSDVFACSTLRLAETRSETSPVYLYQFSHQYGPGLIPDAVPADFNWGAGHAAELPYLFPTYHTGSPVSTTFDADEKMLATQMKVYWGAFVAMGAPNLPQLLPWPEFGESGQVMVLLPGNSSVTTSVQDLRFVHQCDFWDTVLVDTGSFLGG